MLNLNEYYIKNINIILIILYSNIINEQGGIFYSISFPLSKFYQTFLIIFIIAYFVYLLCQIK
jgi:hypothetical protein